MPTRSGVTETYLLIRNPPTATPKVAVIAFVGGFGVIELAGKQVPLKFGPSTNFLIRVRNDLVDADFAEVVVEVPSDKLPQGMSDEFRLGPDHLTDIRAVLADMKKRFPDARVFLMGTSRGTISAAALAAKLASEVQGANSHDHGDQSRSARPGAVHVQLRLDQDPRPARPSSRGQVPDEPVLQRRAPFEELSADQRQRRRSPAVGTVRSTVGAWLLRQGRGRRESDEGLDDGSRFSARNPMSAFVRHAPRIRS